MISKIENAREKYRPEYIKCLLIAEAPPKENSDRFFYYDKVVSGDSLFLETMKVLYPKFYAEFNNAKSVRNSKSSFLELFKDDGFFLVDASEDPMENTSTSAKFRQLRNHLPQLVNRLRGLVTNEPIILISSTVYNTCYTTLIKNGFNILNSELIDFPGSGGQVKFRQKFSTLLNTNGIKP